MPIDKTDEQLLETIADLHGVPEGSFNIRKNGKLLARNSNTDIEIVSKKDKDGIDIIVKPGVKTASTSSSSRASKTNRCTSPCC